MNTLYFEDIEPGRVYTATPYTIELEEMLAFNEKWDRLPIHIDEQVAQAAGHRTVIGSGQYTLCIKQYFVNAMPWREAVIGAIGFDELRFLAPVHGGDTISATIECIDKRESRSKPDRGIVKFNVTMRNEDGTPVLNFIDVVMVKKHNNL